MTENINVQTLEVRRDDWQETRVSAEALSNGLVRDELLLQVDHFALTANNISYAATGDSLGYWRFFPGEDGWGRIPTMGWGTVVASQHPAISVGERVSGFFPMSTHLKIVAGRVSDSSFADASGHRADLAPFYATFQRASSIPNYDPEYEGHDSLLRNLFATGWLVEDFLHNQPHEDVKACLISSASSKTSISLGYCVKNRGDLQSVGITSPGNVAFCERLGCYDKIVNYEEIESLDTGQNVALVDMAGSAKLTIALHEHFGDNLRISSKVGATHYDEATPLDLPIGDLPGAKPQFFFAPTQMRTSSERMGAGEMRQHLAAAYAGFRANSKNWLRIQRGYGPEAVEAAYRAVLAGKTDPAIGNVLSMTPS